MESKYLTQLKKELKSNLRCQVALRATILKKKKMVEKKNLNLINIS